MTPEPSSAVIPTYAMGADNANAGCGFIAKAINGTHWLVTVAHMACWSEPRPNLDFEIWSKTLFLVDRKFGRNAICLFNAPGQPSCRLIYSEIGEPASGRDLGNGGSIDDILAVRFPLEVYQKIGVFADVRIIDLSSPAPPIQRPGDIVAFGFPTPEPDEVEKGRKWPDAEPTVAHGKLYDIQWSRYMAEMRCNHGLCGAPVFTVEGDFCGMVNGSDLETHSMTRIVPDFWIWAPVNDRTIDGMRVPEGYERAPSASSAHVRRFLPFGRIIGDGRAFDLRLRGCQN